MKAIKHIITVCRRASVGVSLCQCVYLPTEREERSVAAGAECGSVHVSVQVHVCVRTTNRELKQKLHLSCST